MGFEDGGSYHLPSLDRESSLTTLKAIGLTKPKAQEQLCREQYKPYSIDEAEDRNRLSELRADQK